MGRFGSFSDNFFRFINENIGITKIHEANLKHSFEHQLEKVELMIERAEFDDDKLNADQASLTGYSDEAVELSSIVKKIGYQKEVCNKKYLTHFFRTFYLRKRGIESLDQGVMQFTRLEVLNLAFNKLVEIQWLPPNLKELHLAGNKISYFAANCKVDSLIHLGLSNNLICDTELPKICQNFPNLFSIDLSYNQVCSLEAVVNNFKELGQIRMIDLKCNPVCISKNYRQILKQRFANLVHLDGSHAFSEAEIAAKKKKKVKRDAYGNVIIDTSDFLPIEKAVEFEMHFRLLQNATGIYLQAEHCPLDYDLTALAPEQKSSVYSVCYVDHEGNKKTSHPKAWINDF